MNDSHLNQESENSMVTCIACSEDIKHGASRCHHCGSYQKKWKNRLPMIGVGAVIAAFVVSTYVAIHSPATDLWDELFGKETIEVITYSNISGMIILNTGNQKVFLENVTAILPEFHADVHSIHDVLDKKDVYSDNKLSKDDGADRTFLPNITDETWESIKLGKAKNVFPAFFTENHPNLKLIKEQMGKSLKLFESECTVHYRSVNNNLPPIQKLFPCVGILFKKTSK